MMSEDWNYAFKLAKRYRPDLTTEELTREWLTMGFQAFVGYAQGCRAGVVFSKEWEDGLTIDGYVDYDVLPRGVAVWYSLEAAWMMLEHLHKYSEKVFGVVDRSDYRLLRFAKHLGMRYTHDWKHYQVFEHLKPSTPYYCTKAATEIIGV